MHDDNVINDTYHDEDSLVMSERGDKSVKDDSKKNLNYSEKRFPKPMIY